MTPRQRELIQDSFARVAPLTEMAAELFYGRLFELDPDLRSLFSGDLRQQGRKLMQTLAVVVLGLDYIERLTPVLQELARRHAGYGVVPEHFAVVGQALLWTLEQALADAFTAETQAAWADLYTLVSTTMQRAMVEPA